MIDQLLAIWGSILGALAAVVLTVRTSIPLVFGDARIELNSTNEKINSKLVSFARGTKKVWGPNGQPFPGKEIPDIFARILDENEQNKQTGVYCQIDLHQEFWKNGRECIAKAYYHVKGSNLTDHIEDYDDFVSMNSKMFDDIRGLSLSDPEEACRRFLNQFAALDFHRGLHQLYLEHKSQEKRIKWLESTTKATGILSVCSLILIMMCVVSSILVIHAQILWGYLLALIAIILFACLVGCALFRPGRSIRWKAVGTVLLLLVSFFSLRSCLPGISDRSLQAFKYDKTDRALFLRILSIEWFKEALIQESNDTPKDANSNSDALTEKKDPTEGGPAKIKGVDTGHEDYKANEKSPLDKAPLKVNDVLDPDLLTKSKNKGKDLNSKDTPTKLDQQIK
jgi:hypothetical protein